MTSECWRKFSNSSDFQIPKTDLKHLRSDASRANLLAFYWNILDSLLVPVPETTSAEAFERYVGGKCLVACRGKAWRDIKAWIIAPLREVDAVHLPSVSESFLAWSMSGEADFEEREGNGPWIKHRIKRGSFFLTFGGAPYDCRWKTIGSEPFQSSRSQTHRQAMLAICAAVAIDPTSGERSAINQPRIMVFNAAERSIRLALHDQRDRVFLSRHRNIIR